MSSARPTSGPVKAAPDLSVMATLKAETAAAHAAVERRVDFEGLASSRDRYRRTLEAFYGFYEPIERAIADAAIEDFDFVPEARTPRLAADLRSLNTDPGRIPRCRDLPALGSPPRIVGALYVLEGASLGGRIIARRLKDGLEIDETTGGSFFHGAGEQTGARWREFGRAAEAAVAPADVGHAVDAARETFSAFEEWLALCDERNDGEAR